MPEMDGEEATRVIRPLPDPGKAELPIIAVTAYCEKGDIERFLEGGMNATKAVWRPEPILPTSPANACIPMPARLKCGVWINKEQCRKLS